MPPMEIEISEPKLTKQQAQALDAEIIAAGQSVAKHWHRDVAPRVLRMERGDGWNTLGFKSFNDYCKSLDERLGTRVGVKRLRDHVAVESDLGIELPASHAYVLNELPTVEARREVFKEVMDEYETPIERNFQTLVDRWFRKHEKRSRPAGKSDSDGWSKEDLEDDGELANALDRIEKIYSPGDRKSIQDGTIGLSRKDIVGLAAFHATKMKEVQQLIMANHWDLATAMKFVNKQPDAKTTVHELQNHCLTTPGFFYTCQVEGFDVSIKACKALAGKIRG